jgi:hypothetical protein
VASTNSAAAPHAIVVFSTSASLVDLLRPVRPGNQHHAIKAPEKITSLINCLRYLHKRFVKSTRRTAFNCDKPMTSRFWPVADTVGISYIVL